MSANEDFFEAEQPIYRLQYTWKSCDNQPMVVYRMDETWCVRFSPSGQSIAVAGADILKVFDAAGKLETELLSGNGTCIFEIDWSKDGNLLATADSFLRVWNVNTGNCVKKLREHEDFLNSAKFSPDDRFILSGSDDRTAKLWDVKTGVCLNTLSRVDPVVAVDFHRDANRFMTISSQTCYMHDLRSMLIVEKLPGNVGDIRSAKFSPDYRHILFSTTDHFLKLYDMRKQEVTGIYKPNPSMSNPVYASFALTASGKHIITGTFATVYIWDVNTQELVQALIHDYVECVDCHPEDDIIVSGSCHNLIKIWQRS